MSEYDASSLKPPAYEPQASSEPASSAFASGDCDTPRTITTTIPDIAWVRAQILDNITFLYQDTHRRLPQDPRIVTYKTTSSPKGKSGELHRQTIAGVMVAGERFQFNLLPVFSTAQSPPAETTELALRGLLERTEIMLGERVAKVSR